MRFPKTGNEQKTVKPAIRKLLTKHGWFWWAVPANGYGQTGVADIHAVKSGMFMVIETKFGKNDPTPMQMAFIDSVRQSNHFAFIVRETTIGAFEAFLTYLDKSIEIAGQNLVPGADVGGPMLDAIKAMSDTEVLDQARFQREAKRAAERKDASDK